MMALSNSEGHAGKNGLLSILVKNSALEKAEEFLFAPWPGLTTPHSSLVTRQPAILHQNKQFSRLECWDRSHFVI